MGKTDKTKQSKRPDSGFSAIRICIFLFLVVLLGVGTTMLLGQQEAYNRVTLQAQALAEEEAEVMRDYNEVQELKLRIGSDEYIEEIARDQLGMVRPGEVIYKTSE